MNYSISSVSLICFFLLGVPESSFAQEPDSIIVDSVKVPEVVIESGPPVNTPHTDSIRHSVRRATVLSAIIPGAGQIYNKKYWKVPVLYGAFAGMAYLINFNNKRFQQYNDALIARLDDDPNTNDLQYTGQFTDENLRTLSDYYHRNRDLSIAVTVLVYALNIIDAHVDAHLYTFDVSDDLSMQVQPVVIPSFQYTTGFHPGVGLSFKF